MTPSRLDRQLKFIQAFADRHGKARYYYRRNGVRKPIEGEFGSSEWLASYKAIHDSFSAASDQEPAPDTFAGVVLSYYRSPKYERLKPKTKSNYRKALEPLVEALGRAKLKDITRGAIVKIRDQIAVNSPRRAIEALKVLNLVFERACDLDLIDRNPARRVENPINYKSEPHRPWSQEYIDTFLAGAGPFWRRAFMVLLYTGLRREDAVNLRRDHIINNRICLTMETTGQATRKTGAEVVIPIVPALAEELARPLPIEGLTLITGTRGRQIRGDVLYHSIMKEAKGLGIEKPPPLHGLRKNAVMRLIEAGLEYREIHAITGQSIRMIEHYGREYDRHRAVDSAVVKLSDKSS